MSIVELVEEEMSTVELVEGETGPMEVEPTPAPASTPYMGLLLTGQAQRVIPSLATIHRIIPLPGADLPQVDNPRWPWNILPDGLLDQLNQDPAQAEALRYVRQDIL